MPITNKVIFFLFATLLFVNCKPKAHLKRDLAATPSQIEKSISKETIDSVFLLVSEQYLLLAEHLKEAELPKTYYPESGKFEVSGSGWWTSGFYPGTLLALYQKTGNANHLKEIERSLAALEKEQFNTNTHDLGFMMFCSFGNRYKMAPTTKDETILMNSAQSLSSRYVGPAQVLRSWNNTPWNQGKDGDVLVIIDNMMNLELLFWASKFSGDPTYYEIAVNHANSTMKNHFRDDYSTYHVVVYDEANGAIKSQITNQGFADESAWARGQAWGLYGYVMMYRETKDENYLRWAEHIANFILNHPNLPEDKVPYWDFDSDKIPNDLRDSSAAAIVASALLELNRYSANNSYFRAAEAILKSLMSAAYLAEKGELGGFVLKHGVGSLPGNVEVDVPLTYGDYYFIEALNRYLDY